MGGGDSLRVQAQPQERQTVRPRLENSHSREADRLPPVQAGPLGSGTASEKEEIEVIAPIVVLVIALFFELRWFNSDIWPQWWNPFKW